MQVKWDTQCYRMGLLLQKVAVVVRVPVIKSWEVGVVWYSHLTDRSVLEQQCVLAADFSRFYKQFLLKYLKKYMI